MTARRLWPRAARTSPEEVLREFYVHGVSVIEVERSGGSWRYQQDSPFNRRVHTLTDTVLTGPAAGSPFMATRYSPDGTAPAGP